MFKKIDITSRSTNEGFAGNTRFAHWHVDNQVYFITSRCRDRFAAFATDGAKRAFWDRFTHWTGEYGFVPWVTTLVVNHFHTIGYLRVGANLSPMMQKFHGSVAKLANDAIIGAGQVTTRVREFWRDSKGREYFDGCIRNEKQARLAYRYTLTQGVRHGIVRDWREYPETRVGVELELAVRRAIEIGAFLGGVPYKRYLIGKGRRPAR